MHEINRTSILYDFIFALANLLNGVYIDSASLANVDTISTHWIKQI